MFANESDRVDEGSLGPVSVVRAMALTTGLLDAMGADMAGLALLCRADPLLLVAFGAAGHRVSTLFLRQIVVGYYGAVATGAGNVGSAMDEGGAGLVAGLAPGLYVLDRRYG